MVENGVNEKGCTWLIAQMLGLNNPLEELIKLRDVAIRQRISFSATEGILIPGLRERVEGLLVVTETPVLLAEFAGIVDKRVSEVLKPPWLWVTRLRFQLDNPEAKVVMDFRQITNRLGEYPDYTGINIDRVREIVRAGVIRLSRSERKSGPIMQFLESQGNQGSSLRRS